MGLEKILNLFNGATFDGGKVVVDGGKFVGCKFKGALLVYLGGSHPTFEHCSFDSVNWAFEGGAGNTLEFLHGLYQSGGFQPVVEQVISYITKNSKAIEKDK